MVHKAVEHSPIMDLFTASQCVSKGPTWLVSATLAGDGANSDAQLFDGFDAKGKEKCHLEALSGTTSRLGLNHPVLFHAGLYIAVNASTSHLTLTYVPVDESDKNRDIWHEFSIVEGVD